MKIDFENRNEQFNIVQYGKCIEEVNNEDTW